MAQIVVQTVLARLLGPADFGLLAQAMIFSSFAALVAEFGIEAALVQRSGLTDAERTGAFWLGLTTASVLAAGVALVSPLVADFFGQPDLRTILPALALTLPLSSLGSVARALLMRSMRFRSLAIVETVGFLAGAVVGVACAVTGFGVASLVAQILTASVVTTAGLVAVTRWRPQGPRAGQVHGLLRFSLNLLGFNAINYWSRNADNLLIGRWLGARALGTYSRGYALMLLPLTQLTWVLSRVMLPTLARFHDDHGRVRAAYLRTVALIALVTFPLMAGMLALAPELVSALLGPQWRPLARILPVFAVIGMAHSVFATVGWIYQSQGRTDLFFRWGVGSSIVNVTGFVIGTALGSPLTVALAYLVTSVVILGYPTFAIPARLIGLQVREIVSCVSGVFLASCGAAVVGRIAAWLAPGPSDPFALLLGTGAGALAYLVGLRLLKPASFADARSLATTAVSRLRTRSAE